MRRKWISCDRLSEECIWCTWCTWITLTAHSVLRLTDSSNRSINMWTPYHACAWVVVYIIFIRERTFVTWRCIWSNRWWRRRHLWRQGVAWVREWMTPIFNHRHLWPQRMSVRPAKALYDFAALLRQVAFSSGYRRPNTSCYSRHTTDRQRNNTGERLLQLTPTLKRLIRISYQEGVIKRAKAKGRMLKSAHVPKGEISECK